MSDKSFKVKNGIDAVGTVTATSFIGDGSQLTGISSYLAPTLGSTSIASNAMVSTLSDVALTDPNLSKIVGSAYLTFSWDSTDQYEYSTDGITWTTNTLPTMSAVYNATYANNKFLVVDAYYGQIFYSSDGITWTISYINNYVEAINYGNGVYVAVRFAENNNYVSTDLVTWTNNAAPGSAANYKQLLFGNGRFVGVVQGGTTKSSTDGITWTTGYMFTDNQRQFGTFGNGKFVVLDRNNDLAEYSTDGISWEVSNLPSYGNWMTVQYGNGVFIGMADFKTEAAYSTDAITWTSVTLPTADLRFPCLTYAGGRFVGTGGDYGSTHKVISTDGITWTLEYGSITTAFVTVGGDLATSGKLYITGNAGSSGQVLKSTGTGVEWGEQAAPTIHTMFAIGGM